MEIEKMSKKELKEVQKNIQKRLDEIEKERARKQRIKDEYTLAAYEPEYYTDYCVLWNHIKTFVESGGVVDRSNIEGIYKNACYPFPVEKSKIYPCPECGKIGYLYVGEFGDASICQNKKKICCSSCGFNYPGKYEYCEDDAWEAFHNWLIKQGYLEKSVEMP